MCLNCGCGQPNEDHGNSANITADDLKAAGEANGQSLRESAQHVIESLALLESSGQDSSGLAKPAGASGGVDAARGTPASES